jgi:hypothetical protein
MAETRRRAPFAPVSEALRDLQAAEVRLRHEQEVVWRKYLAEVDQILAADLRLDEGPAEVDHVAHGLFDEVRGRLDELRVQARLGAMEGEDLVARLRGVVEQLGDRVHLPHR